MPSMLFQGNNSEFRGENKQQPNNSSSLAHSWFIVYDFGRITFIELVVYSSCEQSLCGQFLDMLLISLPIQC